MTIQGSSRTTAEKERGLFGIVQTRLRMLQRPIRSSQTEVPPVSPVRLLIRDALCGSGTNRVEDSEIEGSPFAILSAFADELKRLRVARHKYEVDGWTNFPMELKFSDKRPDAIKALRALMNAKKAAKDPFFSMPKIPQLVKCEPLSAADALEQDMEWLRKHRNRRLMAFVDPNGPKDLPFEQVKKLLTDPVLKRRADVVIHISATSIKRLLGSDERARKNVEEWIGKFHSVFVEGLDADSEAWIREHIPGDRFQWTMLAYWGGYPPRNAWGKARLVKLGSEQGKRAVEYYTTTKKAA